MSKNRYDIDLEQGEIREIIHDVLNEISILGTIEKKLTKK